MCNEAYCEYQYVTALSLRLSEEYDARLSEEARLAGKTRSEIARQAIAEFLERRERERFMAELVQEARRAYADPTLRREAMEIARDAAHDGLDRILAEERAAGIDPDEKWWR